MLDPVIGRKRPRGGVVQRPVCLHRLAPRFPNLSCYCLGTRHKNGNLGSCFPFGKLDKRVSRERIYSWRDEEGEMGMEKGLAECPYEATYALIKGKWTICLLNQISEKPRGFNELLRLNPELSPKMLASKLKMFEDRTVIKRKVLPTTPPSTEYSLDSLGQDLMPLLGAIENWGRHLLARMAQEGAPVGEVGEDRLTGVV